MWMGGTPALGYDVADRRLVINSTEAETVTRIFQHYLELGVRLLRDDVDQRGIMPLALGAGGGSRERVPDP